MTAPAAIALAALFIWSPQLDQASVEQRYVSTTDGVRLHVRVAGSGPPCLFVHGGPGQGSRSFEAMGGSAMQPFLRMIYLDQRGSGASTNASNYHLDRVVKDFDEVIEALGFERVCLIAHSFGGILASEFAARYPGRVSAIIMLNAAVHFHSPYNARMRIEFADRLTGAKTKLPEAATPEQLEAAQVHALEQLAKKGLGYRLLSENPTVQRRMQEADNGYERTLDFGTRVLKERVTYADYYRDHAGTTARVTAPVLVLTGDRDHAVGPAQYRFFRFPNQVVRHIDGGHLMYFEQTDQVVEEIRRFLAGNGFIPDDDHGR